MKHKPWLRAFIFLLLVCGLLILLGRKAQSPPAQPVYHIYAGNTHSHTAYTWSHGEQWINPQKMTEDDAISQPGPDNVLRPNWQKVQGPPSEHFALARAEGFDFYVVTDHSQEAAFQPVSPTNAAWLATLQAAAQATTSNFVAIAGYEHSENNGPGGVGHLNVINSSEYLNALAPGVDLPYLYRWLKTVPGNGDGPVVASFNHPGPRQYDNWAYRDPQVTDIITMLEVINSGKASHYQAFVNALDKGWKVSPVAGADNHGLPTTNNPKARTYAARTFVLATNLTKAAILDAMKHRRTYAALNKHIQCRYTVNGQIMGSTLDSPTNFDFNITINDPDTNNPANQITKIDIVKDGGAVVQTFAPTPDFAVTWSPTISDATNRYFFVRVWDAAGGDVPDADPSKPVAWLAPVWTGR
jgi:hypothetical protein